MTELDDYKKYWKDAKLNAASLEADNRLVAHRLATGEATTAKTSLSRHYIVSIVLGFLMALLSPLLIFVGFPDWLAGFYGVCGFIMALTTGRLLRTVRKLNFYALPTVEALKATVRLSRLITFSSIFRFFLAFAVCGTMLFVSLDMPGEVFYGMIAGLIIGIPLGLLRLRRQFALVRRIKHELRSIAADKE